MEIDEIVWKPWLDHRTEWTFPKLYEITRRAFGIIYTV